MRPCSWPRGCFQWTGKTDPELCEYHASIRDGTIDPADISTLPRRRAALPGEQTSPEVLAEEQKEMAEILRRLGAPEGAIVRVLVPKYRSHPVARGGAENGHGGWEPVDDLIKRVEAEDTETPAGGGFPCRQGCERTFPSSNSRALHETRGHRVGSSGAVERPAIAVGMDP